MKKVALLLLFLSVARIGVFAQSTRPADRAHHSAAYDPVSAGLVVYGGYVYKKGGSRPVGDLWCWNGENWKMLASTPVKKIVAPMVFDDKRNRLLMFGGSDSTGKSDGRLSALENGAWRLLADSAVMARGDAGLVYDSKRDRLVLFGGVNAGKFLADTWEFDGKNWKRASGSGPPARSGAAMAYDSKRGITVLYGGFTPGGAYGDLWEWDGESWKEIKFSGPAPSPRAWPAMAYDCDRKQMVLFGGEDKDAKFFTDTWTYGKKGWKKMEGAGPAVRIQFAMDYDRKRKRTVLFGGFTDPSRYLNDTWEFDGRTWRQKDIH
jgi:hypothetical protein